MKGLLLVIMLCPNLAMAEPFFNEHKEGWFWYIDPKERIDNSSMSKSAPPNPSQEMEAVQKRIINSLNQAILHPTEENLKQYARNYYAVINQGQHFADAYKLMLMKNPLFDYYLRFPVNHNARNIYNREQGELAENAIRRLSRSHGFFFFFAGDCDYCHVFAPTVKRFSDKYGIEVMSISLDGKPLPEYPNVVRDNGIAKKLGVTTLPALFAVNPKTKKVIPLANGVVSVSDLEEIVFKYAEFEKQYGGRQHE